MQVGEKSQIGVYRRQLKLTCLTRVAMSWTVAVGENVSSDTVLTLGPMVLQPRPPFVNDFARLLKMDLQPRSAPVEVGFTGVYGSPYDSLRGCVIITTFLCFYMYMYLFLVHMHLL